MGNDPGVMQLGLARARAAAEVVKYGNSGFRIRVFAMTADEFVRVARGLEGVDTDDCDGHERVAIGFHVTSWGGESCLWASHWGDTEQAMERELRLVVEALRGLREALVEIADDLVEAREAGRSS